MWPGCRSVVGSTSKPEGRRRRLWEGDVGEGEPLPLPQQDTELILYFPEGQSSKHSCSRKQAWVQSPAPHMAP